MKKEMTERLLALVNASPDRRIEVSVPLWTGYDWNYQHSFYTAEGLHREVFGQRETIAWSDMTEDELRDHLECIEEYSC